SPDVTISWMDQPRSIQVQEKYYDPSNEIVTSGDFPSDSPIKQYPINGCCVNNKRRTVTDH
ncbi:unnamed protein product, partial [Rotaria socialis]